MDQQNYTNGYEPQEEKSLWGYYVATITKNYANYKGRARRKEFWGFTLFNMLIASALCIIGFIVFGDSLSSSLEGRCDTLAVLGSIFLSLLFMALYVLAVCIPSVCLTIRRLHDRGLSGWWYGGFIIASFIASAVITVLASEYASVVGSIWNLLSHCYSIWLLVQYCLDSKPGENKWGANPKHSVMPPYEQNATNNSSL